MRWSGESTDQKSNYKRDNPDRHRIKKLYNYKHLHITTDKITIGCVKEDLQSLRVVSAVKYIRMYCVSSSNKTMHIKIIMVPNKYLFLGKIKQMFYFKKYF